MEESLTAKCWYRQAPEGLYCPGACPTPSPPFGYLPDFTRFMTCGCWGCPVLGGGGRAGTNHRPELARLYGRGWSHATPDERPYLPVIKCRIENRSLAELVRDGFEQEWEIVPILADLVEMLKMNRPYGVR